MAQIGPFLSWLLLLHGWSGVGDQVDGDTVWVFNGEMPVAPGLVAQINFDLNSFFFQFPV